ncbi:glycosyl hydrolase family 28-related protein [Jiangella muralis]|uniref:glycosyl hydrolase family 28-related protein n=1 Tax=Jiangella muralis TaxID=702383 RepID=UPI00069F277C|nr:glycosyl hydrolase family 28-related protein [Jiangella muralis]
MPVSPVSRRNLLRSATVGTGALAAGAVMTEPADAAARRRVFAASWEDVKSHGATGDGVTDDLAAITAAIASVDAGGGGVVFFPPGVYRISGPLQVGDGSDSAVSTKHHRITLQGSGRGGSPSLNFVQNTGATEIVYDGPVSTSAAALSLEGPLHSLAVADLVVNANAKAGYAVRVNHVTDSIFTNVMARAATVAGWILTSRNGFPPGCVYGCGNNTLLQCWAYDPEPNAHGLIMTSGVTESITLTGNPDAANNDVIGGVFFYGGGAGTAGFYVHGADNNTVYGAQAIPSGGRTGGNSVYFRPWSGDPRFPLENVFHNIGMSQPVGGTSGTFGNIFATFQEGDGAPVPIMPSITALSHRGVQAAYGKRVYRSRDIRTAALPAAASVTATSFTTVAGLSIALTGAVAGSSKVRVTFSGVVEKSGSGSGELALALDGAVAAHTVQQAAAGTGRHNAGVTAVFDAATAAPTLAVRARSTDGAAFTVHSGSIVVEELY